MVNQYRFLKAIDAQIWGVFNSDKNSSETMPQALSVATIKVITQGLKISVFQRFCGKHRT
ncbi:hypothetical protein GGU45_003046 [Niabella hirudinis]